MFSGNVQCIVGLPTSVVSWNNWCTNSVITWNA